MGYRNYSVGNGFTVDKLGNGDFTTISAAITASVAGDTIYIRPGTYIENITLIPGIALTASAPATATGTVQTQPTIQGTVTFSALGIATISNLYLSNPTSAANVIIVGGAASTTLVVENCVINAANNNSSMIVFSSSSASSNLNIINCEGVVSATGSTLFTHTSAGQLFFFGCNFTNTGLSTTASTVASGSLSVQQTIISNAITSSSTASVAIGNGSFINNAANNTTCITCGGSGAHTLALSSYVSGTASAISISNTTTVSLISVNSSNTNAVTGGGTIINGGVSLIGTSQVINTTTQTAKALSVGGITFDGGTDVLQNYVVGTFTPTIIGGSVAGTTTYQFQNGYYIRVGAMVQVQALITIISATGTGNAIFGGLPFTIKNQSFGTPVGTILPPGGATWVFPAGNTELILEGFINTTTAAVAGSGTGVANGTLQMANAGGSFVYNIVYQI